MVSLRSRERSSGAIDEGRDQEEKGPYLTPPLRLSLLPDIRRSVSEIKSTVKPIELSIHLIKFPPLRILV